MRDRLPPLALLALVLTLVGASSGCAAPLARHSQPQELPSDPAPQALTADEAPARLFEGIEGLWAEVLRIHGLPVTGSEPSRHRLPELERAVRARYASGGFGGPVRQVVAFAVTGRVPITPEQLSELILAPEVEQRLLAAELVERVALLADLPTLRQDVLHVRIKGVGVAAFRVDLDFHLAMERWRLADGRVLLRYDPRDQPAPVHVTLWRGACLLEPLPGGQTRATEVLVLGTDLSVPSLFQAVLQHQVVDTLDNRAVNLWVRARRAAPAVPGLPSAPDARE